MKVFTLTTGFDFSGLVQIFKAGTESNAYCDDNGVDLSTATITASLIARNGGAEIIPDTAQSSVATDADWLVGKINIQFSDSDTATQAVLDNIGKSAFIQLAVTVGANKYSYGPIPVLIQKGY